MINANYTHSVNVDARATYILSCDCIAVASVVAIYPDGQRLTLIAELSTGQYALVPPTSVIEIMITSGSLKYDLTRSFDISAIPMQSGGILDADIADHNNSSSAHPYLCNQLTSLVKSSVPIGGEQGQVLTKASAAHNDVKWGIPALDNLIPRYVYFDNAKPQEITRNDAGPNFHLLLNGYSSIQIKFYNGEDIIRSLSFSADYLSYGGNRLLTSMDTAIIPRVDKLHGIRWNQAANKYEAIPIDPMEAPAAERTRYIGAHGGVTWMLPTMYTSVGEVDDNIDTYIYHLEMARASAPELITIDLSHLWDRYRFSRRVIDLYVTFLNFAENIPKIEAQMYGGMYCIPLTQQAITGNQLDWPSTGCTRVHLRYVGCGEGHEPMLLDGNNLSGMPAIPTDGKIYGLTHNATTEHSFLAASEIKLKQKLYYEFDGGEHYAIPGNENSLIAEEVEIYIRGENIHTSDINISLSALQLTSMAMGSTPHYIKITVITNFSSASSYNQLSITCSHAGDGGFLPAMQSAPRVHNVVEFAPSITRTEFVITQVLDKGLGIYPIDQP